MGQGRAAAAGHGLQQPLPRDEAERSRSEAGSSIRKDGNYRTRLLYLDVIQLVIALWSLDLQE